MPNTLKVENDANMVKKSDTAVPKLLIIDDDESVRKVMRFRLKDSYDIVDSGSPEEALALALQYKPDAILLDLMMPKYSGFEVCQTLSSLSFTSRIPILIVSGESSERYQDYCESLGAKGFFQKPVNVEALQKKLAASGIGTGIHYPVPLHVQEAYRHLNYAKGSFPVSERVASEILSLPMFPQLRLDQIRRVVQAVSGSLSSPQIAIPAAQPQPAAQV